MVGYLGDNGPPSISATLNGSPLLATPMNLYAAPNSPKHTDVGDTRGCASRRGKLDPVHVANVRRSASPTYDLARPRGKNPLVVHGNVCTCDLCRCLSNTSAR